MSDTNVIDHLLKKGFGSQTRLAEVLGCKPHTICGKRKGRDDLTYAQMRRILEAAPTMGIEIDGRDFFPGIQERQSEAA